MYTTDIFEEIRLACLFYYASFNCRFCWGWILLYIIDFFSSVVLSIPGARRSAYTNKGVLSPPDFKIWPDHYFERYSEFFLERFYRLFFQLFGSKE